MNGDSIKEICFSYKGPPEYLESCFNALCKSDLFYELDLPLFKKIMNGKKPKEKMRLKGTVPLLKTFILQLREKFSLDGAPNEPFKKKQAKKVFFETFAPFFTKNSKEIKASSMALSAFNNGVTVDKKRIVQRAVNYLI